MASKSNKDGLHLADETKKEKKSSKNKLMFSGSIIILVLIAVTFIGAPAIGSFTSSTSRLIFGSYDGEPIEYRADNYFSRQRDSIAEQYRESMSGENTEINLQFQLFQIWRQAFEQTVVHIALLSMADDSGVHFTEEQIDNEIVTNGPYMDANGIFDENEYLNTSNTLRQTNRTFVTENMMKNEVISGMFDSRISSGEKDFIKSMGLPEKKFRYAVFPYDEYPADIISEYALENGKLFQKISLSRIMLTESEEQALEVHAEVAEDSSLFEEKARNLSQDSYASKGGVMGSTYYHTLTSFFDESDDLDRIMMLEAGEISDLVVNEDGWYIYRCDEPAVDLNTNKEEELDIARQYIQRYERGRMEDYFTAKGIEFAASALSGSFTDAADEFGVSWHDTDFFPLTYGNIGFSFYGNNYPLFKQVAVPDGDQTLQYISSDMHVLKAMAGLSTENSVSEPLILDEAVVVLQFLEENDTADESAGNTDFYYDYAVNSWKESQLTEGLLASEKLVDNFYEEFGKLISEE